MHDECCECDGYRDEIDDLNIELRELRCDLENATLENAELESSLYTTQQEHAALEKDYDKLRDQLDDVEHSCTSLHLLSDRMNTRWQSHLEYLQENWPEVLTDLLLRGI